MKARLTRKAALNQLDAVRGSIGLSPVQKADAFMSPEAEDVLVNNTCRLYEAISILELVSDVLTQTEGTQEDTSRCMSAVDGALRLLRPIPREIGCRVSMRKAADKIAQRKENNHD